MKSVIKRLVVIITCASIWVAQRLCKWVLYNRPICGRSTGAYTNLGDLQRDLMGVKSHPTKLKKLLKKNCKWLRSGGR
jgi:hypothetical protein